MRKGGCEFAFVFCKVFQNSGDLLKYYIGFQSLIEYNIRLPVVCFTASFEVNALHRNISILTFHIDLYKC